MKAWLKGGLIGGVISLSYYIIFAIIDTLTDGGSRINRSNEKIAEFATYPINFFNIPLHISVSYGFFLTLLYQAIIISLFYFLIGAFIGWIVGKVKSRKQGI